MQVQLSGTVQAILFPRSENAGDFHVISLNCGDKEEIITGSMFGIQVGDEMTVWGERTKHPKHGWQIKLERYEKPMPTTTQAITDYLSSGLIKGVGPAIAKRLVDTFGEETLDIAINDPDKLVSIKGISKAKAAVISEAITGTIAFQQVLSFMTPLGITPRLAIEAFKAWGGSTIEKVKQNPYCLTDLRMVGFAQADEIAWELGIPLFSNFRLKAAALHVLREASRSCGHCYLPTDELIDATLELLKTSGIEKENIETALFALSAENTIIYNDTYTQLYEHAQAESNVFFSVQDMMKPIPSPKIIDLAIKQYEDRQKIKLADLQKQAVKRFFGQKIFILTGGPGTGKTQTVKAITDIAQIVNPDADISLAAPTGRASRRMAEVTGRHAVTIHRMLGLKGEDTETLHSINADILIIDEFSMMDLFLTKKTLNALSPKTRLLIVGDTDQLPSVGPGNVLKDLIKMGVPHVKLTEIFRQAESSQIVTNAHRINAGDTSLLTGSDFFFYPREEPAEILKKITELAVQYKKKHGNIDGLQILSPMKKGIVGTESLNKEIQAAVNPPAHHKAEIKRHVTFREGDRVIHLVNDYDKEVFNGDVGIIKSIAKDAAGETCLSVEYPSGEVSYEPNELDALALAYAVTVHKSQGSEYPVVIVPLATSHYIMLARNLIYTAVTRATEKAIVVGSRKAHAIAVKNNAVQSRYTRLANYM